MGVQKHFAVFPIVVRVGDFYRLL